MGEKGRGVFVFCVDGWMAGWMDGWMDGSLEV